jgi:hypothetical protein
MSDYILAIIIGVLSSFVASFIFLLILTRIRPAVIISDKIAKTEDSTTGDVIYKIKIINKTHRSIINVKAQLRLITLVAAPGGLIEQNRTIPLRTDYIMELPKFNLKDKNVEYAWRFNVDGNIEKLWNDDERSFLRFKIFATDGVSGFGRVFNRDFHIKKNSIIKGVFEYGNTCDIK